MVNDNKVTTKDKKEKQTRKTKTKLKPQPMSKPAWILLLVGFIAFIFSSGRWNIFITAWIWPCAFLYFSRRTNSVKQFMILVVAITIGHTFKWLNILDAGYIIDAVLCIVWSICWIIPFIADRLLAKNFKGIASTLVFPAVFIALEFLRTFTLVGSFGTTAYTQSGLLPLVQITSVVGSFGLSFLILWFGSVLAFAIDCKFQWAYAKRAVCVYLAFLIVALGFGSIRLIALPVDYSDTVKVASIICPYYSSFSDGNYETISYEEAEAYLISEAERAATADTDIACWNEESFDILDTEEADFIETAKSLSAEYDMDMILAYETGDTDDSEGGLSVNKISIIEPDGNVTEYIKTKLVPVIEASEYVTGTGEIPTVVTDEAVISSVICFDDNYIGYIHGLGADTEDNYLDTDIMFVPSWDWQSVENAHTQASEFRAVENGFALVKPSYDGISTAVDYQGHVIKRFNTEDTGFDTVQITEVPVDSVDTIYSKLGNVIDFAFFVFGVVMTIIGIALRKRTD